MKLSDMFNLKSEEGRYLNYLLSQYDKVVIEPYVSLFVNREANLEVLLNDEFCEIKKETDNAIKLIHDCADKLDINNLTVDELTELANLIDLMAGYIEHVKSIINKEELPF